MAGASATGFPVDSTMPGLAVAGDPDAMLACFKEHLRPLPADSPPEILGCRLARVRHRRGERCILQYALRLSGAHEGRELPVIGLLYAEAGAAERLWRKLRDANPDGEPAGSAPGFEPVSFVPELGMVVQVFPYDRRLPGLRSLAYGPPPSLEAVLLSRFGPGDWGVEACETEVVRYREQLGAVLRYGLTACETATGTRAKRRFYVKVYGDGAGERTLGLLDDLARSADAGGGFDVGRPVAYLGDQKALVLEEARGVTLEQVVLGDGDPAHSAREVARALVALHRTSIRFSVQHTLGDQAANLERAGKILGLACPHLAPEVESLVGAIVGELVEAPPAPVHGDLKPDHVFLDDGRVVFVDLDSFAMADPVLDPASLLARLVAMPHLHPVPRGRALLAARVFAGEYFGDVPEDRLGRLRPLYAGSVLEVAHGFFRRQEPLWPEKVAALVDEAGMSIKGEGLLMENLQIGETEGRRGR